MGHFHKEVVCSDQLAIMDNESTEEYYWLLSVTIIANHILVDIIRPHWNYKTLDELRYA